MPHYLRHRDTHRRSADPHGCWGLHPETQYTGHVPISVLQGSRDSSMSRPNPWQRCYQLSLIVAIAFAHLPAQPPQTSPNKIIRVIFLSMCQVMPFLCTETSLDWLLSLGVKVKFLRKPSKGPVIWPVLALCTYLLPFSLPYSPH